MQVVKRNGKIEEVKFDKISRRIKQLSKGLKVDPAFLTQRVATGLYDQIPTAKIDTFLAESAAVLSSEHHDYARLAARIAISSLHKETNISFLVTTRLLYIAGILSEDYLSIVEKHAEALEAAIDYERDFNFDYFGFKTLERSYLLKIDGKIAERPQHLFMRVAAAVCAKRSVDDIIKLYNHLSQGLYTHATPTLFNAGTSRQQMSSCFLISMEEDSIDGIFNTLKECAQISKNAGGIGLHIHNIRATGSRIRGNNGTSNGIVPMLKVFNETARYVDQGGRRKGSFAVYLEPWHADIEQFLELKKPTGKDELRTRDLFLALWVPDLFMERVEKDLPWTLMDPNEQPGLSDVYGEEFRKLYEQYEAQFSNLHRMPARELMTKIIESMLESGTPYVLFKDSCNEKSNQKNIGTIKSSNLCLRAGTLVQTKTGVFPIEDLVGETVEVYDGISWVKTDSFTKTNTSAELLRITLADGSSFDCTPYHKVPLATGEVIEAREVQVGQILKQHDLFDKCYDKTVTTIETLSAFDETYCCHIPTTNQFALANGLMTGNCAEIIEYSDAKESAVCNLASICLPAFVADKQFDFEKLASVTRDAIINLNEVIDGNFYPTEKTKASNARHRPVGLGVQGMADVFFKLGLPYASPEAKALDSKILETMYFHALDASCDLAKEKGAYETFADSPLSQGLFQFDLWGKEASSDLDWAGLKEKIQKYGVRNSLLLALMPTASTSQIFGNTESFEPITSNLYKRQTLAGEFVVVNRYLIQELEALDLWTPEMREKIVREGGSIQNIAEIPAHLRDVFKTVWEISQRDLIDHAAARGPFVCQSQSMNLYFAKASFGTINSALFYGWKQGLKTGVYYTRTRPATEAVKVTTKIEEQQAIACSIDNPDACIMCQ